MGKRCLSGSIGKMSRRTRRGNKYPMTLEIFSVSCCDGWSRSMRLVMTPWMLSGRGTAFQSTPAQGGRSRRGSRSGPGRGGRRPAPRRRTGGHAPSGGSGRPPGAAGNRRPGGYRPAPRRRRAASAPSGMRSEPGDSSRASPSGGIDSAVGRWARMSRIDGRRRRTRAVSAQEAESSQWVSSRTKAVGLGLRRLSEEPQQEGMGVVGPDPTVHRRGEFVIGKTEG